VENINGSYLSPEDKAKLDSAYNTLKDIHTTLVRVNTQSGALARFEAIEDEINEKGWPAVQQKYHPDFNIDDPAAIQMYEFVKFVHQSMESGPRGDTSSAQ
jgi:hypothetical protein